MLWIKLKPDESIDVKDTDGNLLGVLTAHQRGGSVRIGFDGLKQLIFKRRIAAHTNQGTHDES
jgi:hypothetical protein